MAEHAEFQFECTVHAGDASTYVARVPRGLTTTQSLLAALSDALQFPDYFGFNWNALADCLRDFHWMEQREVVLAHEDLPAIPAADLSIYLDVLAESVRSWRPDEPHALRVLFPADLREQVFAAIDAPRP